MNRYIHIIISTFCMIFCLMTASSCLEKEDWIKENIKLKGSLVPSHVFTKGEGVLDSQYPNDLEIGLARIDQKETAGYPSFANTKGQLRAKMEKGQVDLNTRDISFTDVYQQFNNETDYIKYASWYPYASDSFDQATHSITTPIDGNTDIMYGSIATGNQKEGFNTIYFDHALCKFTFYVYAMVPQDFTQQELNQLWGKLKNINLLGLATECKITLPETGEGIYNLTYPGENVDNIISIAKKDANANLLEQLPIGAANAIQLPALIAAPPSTGILRVKVETDNGQQQHQISSKTMTIARNFKPGKNYDIYLRFSDHGLINAEVSIDEWGTGTEVENDNINNKIYYDLSTAEHANSYIVTSANYSYCFDVTTIGNGEIGKIGNINTTIAPQYLDIIWMDEGLENYFKLENHTPIQNRVLFNVTNDRSNAEPTDDDDKSLSKEGNVLIGAYDAKGGNLLWTWHVWLTDRPEEQAYKNGFVVLDRDLGAIAASAATKEKAKELDGLYYQWGRPTPLPLGFTMVKPLEAAEGKPNGTKQIKMEDHTGQADMMARIAHPKWYYTEANSIQSQPEFKNYWGFNLNTLEYQKTIFDPCPPGYRIPSKSMFQHMEYLNMTLNQTHGHSYESTVDTYYKMNNALSGYYTNSSTCVGYYKGDEPQVPNPAGAYLWSGTLNMEEKPVPDVWSPYSMDCILGFNKVPGEGVISKHSPTDAIPVRCVSKRSIPETRNLSEYQTANSYLVTKTGYYKFKATVRGNGINKLVKPGSGESIDISENLTPDIADKAYQVVPLWWQGDLSTQNGNVDPNTTSIPVVFINDGLVNPDGYVFFSVKDARKGNLIIAVKDQLGNILWSWHLWLTDEPKTHNSYDYAVMDRFLGATVAPTANPTDKQYLGSLGFYYEWGRKDPFPGPSAAKSANYSTWWKYDEDTQKWSQMNGLASSTNIPAEKTVVNSVKDPTRYHLSQDQCFSGGNITKDGFAVKGNDDLMRNQCFSNTLNQASMWGYSSMSGGIGKTTTKTMYDPCPPGYSVAYYLMWTYSTTGQDSPIYTGKDSGTIDATYMTQSNKNGIFLNYSGFSKTWYPYTGYINSSDGKLREVGYVGRFHSCTPAGNGSRSLCYWPSGKTIYTSQAIDGAYKGIPSSYAYPVRCQKD